MKIENLDFGRLRAFQLVARQGNLRSAAIHLKQTPSAVSARLKRLEQEVGVELFERLANRLILTPSGERFLDEVDSLLEHAENAMRAIDPSIETSGRISVTTGSDQSWFFAPRISKFIKRYPSAQLSLRIFPAADALHALLRGERDVSVGIFPTVPKTLERKGIVETTMSLVCKPGHAILARRPIDLQQISGQTLILFPGHSDTRRLVDQALARRGIKPKSVVEVSSCQTATTFVELGVGIAILHTLCINHAVPRSVEWVDLGASFGKIPFSIVYRRRAQKAGLTRCLIDELTSEG